MERGSRRVAALVAQVVASGGQPGDEPSPPRQRAGEASRRSVVRALDDHGYCIVSGFLPPAKLAALRADMLAAAGKSPTGRNKFEGSKTRRVYAVFAKTREFDDIVTDPLVLGVLEDVLGTAHFNLSSPTGIQIGPGEREQILHRDDGKYPIPRPHQEVVVNTMFALDDFTEVNGSTLFVPGSHLARTDGWAGTEEDAEGGDLAQQAAARQQRGQAAVLGKRSSGDGSAATAASASRRPGAGPAPVPAVMPAGSVLFYRGSLLHGGGANTSDAPRLGVIMEFCAGWLRPQENHVLAVPRSIARTLPVRLQELLGYNVVPPFVGYVDGRHPRKSLEVEESGSP